MPPSDKNALAALWGKLASEILMQDWDTALDDLNRLKDVIDAGVSTIKKIDRGMFVYYQKRTSKGTRFIRVFVMLECLYLIYRHFHPYKPSSKEPG